MISSFSKFSYFFYTFLLKRKKNDWKIYLLSFKVEFYIFIAVIRARIFESLFWIDISIYYYIIHHMNALFCSKEKLFNGKILKKIYLMPSHTTDFLSADRSIGCLINMKTNVSSHRKKMDWLSDSRSVWAPIGNQSWVGSWCADHPIRIGSGSEHLFTVHRNSCYCFY